MRRKTFFLACMEVGLLILMVITLLGCPAFAEEKERDLLVLIVLEQNLPQEIESDTDPGRIEVTNNGAFVGCMFAPVHRDRWKNLFIVGNQVGFRTFGKPSQIRVDTYGELKRISKPQLIVKDLTP